MKKNRFFKCLCYLSKYNRQLLFHFFFKWWCANFFVKQLAISLPYTLLVVVFVLSRHRRRLRLAAGDVCVGTAKHVTRMCNTRERTTDYFTIINEPFALRRSKWCAPSWLEEMPDSGANNFETFGRDSSNQNGYLECIFIFT